MLVEGTITFPKKVLFAIFPYELVGFDHQLKRKGERDFLESIFKVSFLGYFMIFVEMLIGASKYKIKSSRNWPLSTLVFFGYFLDASEKCSATCCFIKK